MKIIVDDENFFTEEENALISKILENHKNDYISIRTIMQDAKYSKHEKMNMFWYAKLSLDLAYALITDIEEDERDKFIESLIKVTKEKITFLKNWE